MKTYLLIRKKDCHQAQFPDDLSARKAAPKIRGVIRVEDGNGRVVWRYVRPMAANILGRVGVDGSAYRGLRLSPAAMEVAE